MNRTTSRALVFSLAAVCGLASSAGAAVQSKCVVGKNKCMSKKAGSLLKCHQKAETPGKPADPDFGDCITKAQNKFDGAPDPTKGCFEKLENKTPNDCVTFDDTAAAEAIVDSCVAQLVTAIDPGPAITQSKCGVGKKKCVAKKLKSILKCHQKAQTPGKPNDPNFGACLDKAMDKFDGGSDPSKGCFVKLENKPGNDCQPPIGNQAALEALVDGGSCVGAFIALIETPPTTSTSTTTTSSTTTTTSSVEAVFLDFATGAPGGVCGDTRDGSNAVLRTITCGSLNLGGGESIVTEGLVPEGSISRFLLFCPGSSCTIAPTASHPPVNSATPDCTTTGCTFGTPLPIPNPVIPTLTTCVMNTWATPASGALDLATGAATTSVALTSDIYLTGNLAQPCPRCSASGTPSTPGTGTCDRGPRAGLACTTTNPEGYTRDCPTGGVGSPGTPCPGPGSGCAATNCPCTPGGGACCDGSHVGPFDVNLSPLTTATVSETDPGGLFCPDQPSAGCFGSPACRTITVNGVAAGPISFGTPAGATLGSVFCIPPTGLGTIDAAANLPGPGAVALRGTFLVH